MIAASELLGVIAFMKAAFGVRFLAGAFAFFAGFFAGAAFLAAFFAGAALLTAFLTAGRFAAVFFPAFFAVAMSILSIK